MYLDFMDFDIEVRETLLQHKEIIFHGGVLGALCKCNEDNVYPAFSVWLCSRGGAVFCVLELLELFW